jgi:hypothetical protein
VIEDVVTVGPPVVEVLEEGQSEVIDSGVEGQYLFRAVRLVEHALAARQPHRVRIAEPAHAAHRAEVVIEGAVLLHEDHDMFDVANRSGAVVAFDRRGAGNARGEDGGRGGSGAELEEAAAADRGHPGRSSRGVRGSQFSILAAQPRHSTCRMVNTP